MQISSFMPKTYGQDSPATVEAKKAIVARRSTSMIICSAKDGTVDSLVWSDD